MNSEVNFTKSTLANYFSNFIVVNLSREYFSRYVAQNRVINKFTRSQRARHNRKNLLWRSSYNCFLKRSTLYVLYFNLSSFRYQVFVCLGRLRNVSVIKNLRRLGASLDVLDLFAVAKLAFDWLWMRFAVLDWTNILAIAHIRLRLLVILINHAIVLRLKTTMSNNLLSLWQDRHRLTSLVIKCV